MVERQGPYVSPLRKSTVSEGSRAAPQLYHPDYAPSMLLPQSLAERLTMCDMEVRNHLNTGERVLAVGRCADITEVGGPEDGGTASAYVMITTDKLRWVPYSHLYYEAALGFDEVTAFTERTLAHRYAICLRHPPLDRLRMVPDEVFPPEWRAHLRAKGHLRGDGRSPLSRTEIAFSRRDTRAARALREALTSRLSS